MTDPPAAAGPAAAQAGAAPAAAQTGAAQTGAAQAGAGTDDEAGGNPGRVVLVTGGARGIGAACVEWFRARGDRVAATHRPGGTAPETPGTPDAPDTPDTPQAPGDTATTDDSLLWLPCDITDADGVEAAFRTVEERWGPVEVLVSNAGITRDTLVLRMGDDAWDAVIATNLTGSFRVAKRALAKMVRARRGRIVFLSSVGAFVGLPGQANYAATKAGLVGMARAMAREVASRGITVNVVAPGIVDTDMVAALGEQRVQDLVGQVPLGRAAAPMEIAGAVGFLASQEAGYITGAVLPVDGGLGMGL